MLSKRTILFVIITLISVFVIIGCAKNPMDTPYFEFASEYKSIETKAEIVEAPDYVNHEFFEISSDPTYAFRRAVAVGVTAEQLIAFAFGTNSGRILHTTELPDTRFIAEVIVPNSSRHLLMETLRKEVIELFNIDTYHDYTETEVWELSVAETVKFPVSKKANTTWSQKDGHIAATKISLSLLAVTLEKILGEIPVLNSIDDDKEYDVYLKWRTGDVEDLKRKLKTMGITMEKTTHEISMLVVAAPLKNIPEPIKDEIETKRDTNILFTENIEEEILYTN